MAAALAGRLPARATRPRPAAPPARWVRGPASRPGEGGRIDEAFQPPAAGGPPSAVSCETAGVLTETIVAPRGTPGVPQKLGMAASPTGGYAGRGRPSGLATSKMALPGDDRMTAVPYRRVPWKQPSKSEELRKRFGTTLALDGPSFTVAPGTVTGFVGPNGAGKSTTMRAILGSGHARRGERPHRRPARRQPPPPAPPRRLAARRAAALHPSRNRGRNHVLWLAHSQGLNAKRADAVIEQAGLGSAARRKAGGLLPRYAPAFPRSPPPCWVTRRC